MNKPPYTNSSRSRPPKRTPPPPPKREVKFENGECYWIKFRLTGEWLMVECYGVDSDGAYFDVLQHLDNYHVAKTDIEDAVHVPRPGG